MPAELPPMPDAGATAPASRIDEIVKILAPFPIFARFDRASLRAVASECRFESHPAGATLMREGELGTFACVVLEGEVDVFVELPSGPINLAAIGRNGIIGELGVFTDMPRTATVTTRSDLSAIRIEHDSLMKLSAKYPSIAVSVIRELGRRLGNMNQSLAYLTYAAEALGHDDYDPSFLDELTNQSGELAP